MNKEYNLIKCNTAEEFWAHLSPEKPLKSTHLVDSKDSKFIFRGQANSEWGLEPSVLRHSEGNPNPAHRAFGRTNIQCDEQIMIELQILRNFVEACDASGLRINNDSSEFRSKYLDPHTAIDLYFKKPSEWPNEKLHELMALAQHHRVPTRLLDWSSRSYVAAYFAASDALKERKSCDKDNRMTVWVLEIEFKRLYNTDVIILKVPGSTSSNLAAQSGLFSLFRERYKRGDQVKLISMEQVFTKFEKTPLWKITLPVKYSGEIIRLCKLYGVSAATLFPGYDGAAMEAIDNIHIRDKLK